MSDTRRQELARSLAQVGGPERGDGSFADGVEGPSETILLGWVVIAEWAGSDGNRWLSRLAGSGAGEHIPGWQSNGYLHEGIYGDWGDDE